MSPTMDQFSLEKRKALVTGGSRGIGAATVELFVGQGAELCFCHHDDDENALILGHRLAADGSNISYTDCDVANEASVEVLGEFCHGRLGRLDIGNLLSQQLKIGME